MTPPKPHSYRLCTRHLCSSLSFLLCFSPVAYILLFLVESLPLRRPGKQLLPVPARMPSPKSRHAPDALIFHLDGRIRLAHQTLAYNVDTMGDVAG